MFLLNNVLFPFVFATSLVLPVLNALEEEVGVKKNGAKLQDNNDENGNMRHFNDFHASSEEKLSLLSREKRAGNRCKPKSKCKKFGGSCDQFPCDPLNQREIKKGCRKPDKCKCCAPGCEAKGECSLAGGSCVEKKKACKATGGFILKGGCTGKKCLCCVPNPVVCFPPCGENRVCELGKCKCNDGWGGDACNLPDSCADYELDPDFTIELPDLNVLLSCISFPDLSGCISGDFRPCLTKLLECNSELLPDGFPSDCIDDFIDEFVDDIPNLPDIGDLLQISQ